MPERSRSRLRNWADFTLRNWHSRLLLVVNLATCTRYKNLCEFERVNLTTIALPGTKETHKSPARPAATTRVQRVLL